MSQKAVSFRTFMVFLSPSRHMLGVFLKADNAQGLPLNFQYLVHNNWTIRRGPLELGQQSGWFIDQTNAVRKGVVPAIGSAGHQSLSTADAPFSVKLTSHVHVMKRSTMQETLSPTPIRFHDVLLKQATKPFFLLNIHS
jgi:hypothetical protein